MSKYFKIEKNEIIKILKIFNIIFSNIKENFIIYKKKNNLFFLYKNEEIQIIFKLKKTYNINFKKISLNFKNFFNIIKKINKKEIKIEIKKNIILLKDKINYKLKYKKIKNKKVKKYFLNSFFIKKTEINLIIKFFNMIIIKNNIFNKLNLILKNNFLKFIINNNNELIYYIIKIDKIFKKNISFKFNLKFIKIIDLINNRLLESINFKIYKNLLILKTKNIKIIIKIKNYKNIIIKNYKKKYKYYITLKKEKIENILKGFNLNDKDNNLLEFIFKKDNLNIIKNINKNILKKKLKINYKNKKIIKFYINYLKILNFLKNIKYKDIILNITKNNFLVITIPQLKKFKYMISIINI